MSRRLALVTGASAGLGAAFAREFAARGYDVALVARRADRLQALAAELRLTHRVEALVLPCDLSQPGSVDTLLNALKAKGRSVDALVNNAGFGVDGRYTDAGWDRHGDSLQVMLTGVCELTHRLLPGMIERGYGRVLNVASVAALIPGVAGHTLYAATKSFLVKFSQSLHVECAGSGVHVTALCPGFTFTEFHDVDGSRASVAALPKWMWTTAPAVAAAGFRAVEANRPVSVPGAHNRVLRSLIGLLPESWVLRLAARSAAKSAPAPQPAAPAFAEAA